MSTKLNNFYHRTLTSLILFPAILCTIYFGGILFFLLMFIIVLLSCYEWNDICGKWSFGIDGMIFSSFIMVSFTSVYMGNLIIGICIFFIGIYISYLVAKLRSKSELKQLIPNYLNRPLWYVIGYIYLSIGFCSMGYITQLDNTININLTVIWIFLSTVFNDVFAYIFGSLIGGKKIAPKISPGKSWSGLFFASISTAILSYMFSIYLNSNNELFLIIIGFSIGFVAHFGDMLESYFKRYLNIKDTSNLIPGHGGILDRIDALLMVSIYIAIISLIIGKSPLFL